MGLVENHHSSDIRAFDGLSMFLLQFGSCHLPLKTVGSFLPLSLLRISGLLPPFLSYNYNSKSFSDYISFPLLLISNSDSHYPLSIITAHSLYQGLLFISEEDPEQVLGGEAIMTDNTKRKWRWSSRSLFGHNSSTTNKALYSSTIRTQDGTTDVDFANDVSFDDCSADGRYCKPGVTAKMRRSGSKLLSMVGLQWFGTRNGCYALKKLKFTKVS